MKTHWFYYIVKYVGKLGLSLFFGGVKLYGKDKIPTDGALIFAPNHQGAFMDAVLVGVFTKKPITFLTRSDVFNKWSMPILKSLNMMPIYRIRDGIKSLAQNDAVFEMCYKILSDNYKALLIFPEGNHGIEHYLRPLSKGTARLALDARNELADDKKLYVIPTGINYFSHYRPLSKVHLVFGEPIELEQYMELYEEHKQKAYNRFREDLTVAMKKTLILEEEKEDHEQRRDFVFQPKHEDMHFEALKELAEQPEVGERKPYQIGAFSRFWITFFALFNFVPLMALHKLLSGIKDKVFFISLKYLVGGILHLIWWMVLLAVGWTWLGWEAGLLFVAVAILAMFARQKIIKY